MPDTLTVTHNPDARQFEIRTEAGTALLRYRQRGGDLELLHTEVPESMEGRGYGAALAKAALDFASERGMKVIPSCPFVSAYIRRHPERRALVATG